MSPVATLTPPQRPAPLAVKTVWQPPSAGFEIGRVALAPLRPGEPSPPPVREVALSSRRYTAEQRRLITRFLGDHLRRSWELEEGGRTRFGVFRSGAEVYALYRRTAAGKLKFVDACQALAARLLAKTPANASEGVLLMLWYREGGTKIPRLALLKLDPGPHTSVYLEQDAAGQMLLQIAARHVEFELPEPGDRVLKWALVPAPPGPPDEPAYEVKLRDEQGDSDPAWYFVDFLECRDYESEARQASVAIGLILDHAKQKRRLRGSRRMLRAIRQAADARERVTVDSFVDWASEAGLVRPAERTEVERRLQASKADRMRARPEVFERLQLRYELDSGPAIVGTVTEILTQVDVDRTPAGYRFTLEAGEYDILTLPG